MHTSYNIPELWPSIARLLATLAIFVFHYFALIGENHYHLNVYAILTFCFLSGYLSGGRLKNPHKWLFRRYFTIMVPYWLVILCVITANYFYEYKDTDILRNLITFFGGSFFLRDPLYVISWFITLILLLYIFSYVYTLISWKLLRLLYTISSFIFFATYLHTPYYFLAYFIGMVGANNIREICSRPHKSDSTYMKTTVAMFQIQKYCYPFFLVHPGIMLFLHILRLESSQLFLATFMSSVLSSSILYHVAEILKSNRIPSIRQLTFAKSALVRGNNSP